MKYFQLFISNKYLHLYSIFEIFVKSNLQIFSLKTQSIFTFLPSYHNNIKDLIFHSISNYNNDVWSPRIQREEQFLISKIWCCSQRAESKGREGDWKPQSKVIAAENCNALRSVSSQHELIGIQRGTFIFASRAKCYSENNSVSGVLARSRGSGNFFFRWLPPATSKTAIDRECACNRWRASHVVFCPQPSEQNREGFHRHIERNQKREIKTERKTARALWELVRIQFASDK